MPPTRPPSPPAVSTANTGGISQKSRGGMTPTAQQAMSNTNYRINLQATATTTQAAAGTIAAKLSAAVDTRTSTAAATTASPSSWLAGDFPPSNGSATASKANGASAGSAPIVPAAQTKVIHGEVSSSAPASSTSAATTTTTTPVVPSSHTSVQQPTPPPPPPQVSSQMMALPQATVSKAAQQQQPSILAEAPVPETAGAVPAKTITGAVQGQAAAPQAAAATTAPPMVHTPEVTSTTTPPLVVPPRYHFWGNKPSVAAAGGVVPGGGSAVGANNSMARELPSMINGNKNGVNTPPPAPSKQKAVAEAGADQQPPTKDNITPHSGGKGVEAGTNENVVVPAVTGSFQGSSVEVSKSEGKDAENERAAEKPKPKKRIMFKLLPPGYLDFYGNGKVRKVAHGSSPALSATLSAPAEPHEKDGTAADAAAAAAAAKAIPRISERYVLEDDELQSDLLLLRRTLGLDRKKAPDFAAVATAGIAEGENPPSESKANGASVATGATLSAPATLSIESQTVLVPQPEVQGIPATSVEQGQEPVSSLSSTAAAAATTTTTTTTTTTGPTQSSCAGATETSSLAPPASAPQLDGAEHEDEDGATSNGATPAGWKGKGPLRAKVKAVSTNIPSLLQPQAQESTGGLTETSGVVGSKVGADGGGERVSAMDMKGKEKGTALSESQGNKTSGDGHKRGVEGVGGNGGERTEAGALVDTKARDSAVDMMDVDETHRDSPVENSPTVLGKDPAVAGASGTAHKGEVPGAVAAGAAPLAQQDAKAAEAGDIGVGAKDVGVVPVVAYSRRELMEFEERREALELQETLVKERLMERREAFSKERIRGERMIKYLQLLEEEERQAMALLATEARMLEDVVEMLPERQREIDSLRQKLEAAKTNKMSPTIDDSTKKSADQRNVTNDGTESKLDGTKAKAGGTSPVPAPCSLPSSCSNSQTDAASSARAAGEVDQSDGLDDHLSPAFVGKGKGRAIPTGGIPRPHTAADHQRGKGLPPSAGAVMPGAEGGKGEEGVTVDCDRSMAGRAMLRTWNAMGERAMAAKVLVKTLEVELEAKAAPFTVTDEVLAASALAGRDNDGRMTTRRRANLRATAASLRNGGKRGVEMEHDDGRNDDMVDNDDGKEGDPQQANKHSFKRAGSHQHSDTSDSDDSLADVKVPVRGLGGRFRSRRQPVAEKTFKNDKTTNKKRKGGGADRSAGVVDKRPKGSGKTKPAGRTRVEGAPLLDWPSRSLPRTPYGVPLLLSCISTHPDKVAAALHSIPTNTIASIKDTDVKKPAQSASSPCRAQRQQQKQQDAMQCDGGAKDGVVAGGDEAAGETRGSVGCGWGPPAGLTSELLPELRQVELFHQAKLQDRARCEQSESLARLYTEACKTAVAGELYKGPNKLKVAFREQRLRDQREEWERELQEMEDEIRKATPIPPSSPSPPQTESEPAATPTPPAPPAPAASAPAATPAPKPAENKLPALAPPAESDAAPAVSAAAAVPTVALESGKGRGSGVLKGKDGKFVRRGGNLATRSSHKEVSQVSAAEPSSPRASGTGPSPRGSGSSGASATPTSSSRSLPRAAKPTSNSTAAAAVASASPAAGGGSAGKGGKVEVTPPVVEAVPTSGRKGRSAKGGARPPSPSPKGSRRSSTRAAEANKSK